MAIPYPFPETKPHFHRDFLIPRSNIGDILTIRGQIEQFFINADVEHKSSVRLSLLVGASADATLL
jgi:hypothetical protein